MLMPNNAITSRLFELAIMNKVLLVSALQEYRFIAKGSQTNLVKISRRFVCSTTR